MSWIILILAGLMEMRTTFWRIFFITTLVLSIIGLKVLGW